MLNELQPNNKFIFKAGRVFFELKGERKPTEAVVDTNSSAGAELVNTLKAAAADFAELNGR